MTGEIVNSVAYARGRRVCDVAIDQVREVLRQPDTFIWIGLCEPGEELLRRIQQEFGLHDLAVEDAHRAHQRPKIERYGDSLFVVLRTAQMNPATNTVECGETHIFVGARYVVAVRHGASQPYVAVRARVETTPHLLALGPGFVLYALMDFIVDQYFPVIDALEQRLEDLEDAVFGESYSRVTTAQLYRLQRELVEIKRVISPLVEICSRLARFDHEAIPEATHVYFRDVYDHVVHANEMADTLRELLGTTLGANFSLISITQNEVMKRFAGWAAIIAVPTMVAGIYGMNFEHMPELHQPVSYPLMLAGTVAVCAALFYYFRRAGWL
jgi:magnesium transporter